MVLKRACDRCGKPLTVWNEALQDQIDSEYPGKDICPDCDLNIKLAQSCAATDTIKGLKPGTSAQRMLEKYSEPKRGDHRIR